MATYDCVFHKQQPAEYYDCCRHVDSSVLDTLSLTIWELYRQICKRHNLTPSGAIVESGVGLGRLFLPVVKNRPECYRSSVKVIGLDVAKPMLHGLNKKLAMIPNEITRLTSTSQWDIQDPYPSFGSKPFIVYTLATFHILNRWQEALKHIVDTLAPEGLFLYVKEINQFMHQTEGFDGDSELETQDTTLTAFMREYHSLRESHGVCFERSGILYSDVSPATQELERLGFRHLKTLTGDGYKWQKPHSFSSMLHALEHRLITTWGTDIPDDERISIVSKLAQWLEIRSIDIESTFYIPARFELFVYGRGILRN